MQLDLYYKFLGAQALGFDGDFEEFVSSEIAQPVIDSMPPDDDEFEEVLFLLITHDSGNLLLNSCCQVMVHACLD